MKKFTIVGALVATLALGACANGRLTTPSEAFAGNEQLMTAAANFCREDFVEANTPAIVEGVQFWNIAATLLGKRQIDTEELFARPAVQELLRVRKEVCVAAVPTPVVVEAIAEADVEVVADGVVEVEGEVAPLDSVVE